MGSDLGFRPQFRVRFGGFEALFGVIGPHFGAQGPILRSNLQLGAQFGVLGPYLGYGALFWGQIYGVCSLIWGFWVQFGGLGPYFGVIFVGFGAYLGV